MARSREKKANFRSKGFHWRIVQGNYGEISIFVESKYDVREFLGTVLVLMLTLFPSRSATKSFTRGRLACTHTVDVTSFGEPIRAEDRRGGRCCRYDDVSIAHGLANRSYEPCTDSRRAKFVHQADTGSFSVIPNPNLRWRSQNASIICKVMCPFYKLAF